MLLVIRSAAVLRILAITTIDRMIPNFASLDEALAYTSPNEFNGHRRRDDGPGGSATKIAGTVAQHVPADPADERAE